MDAWEVSRAHFDGGFDALVAEGFLMPSESSAWKRRLGPLDCTSPCGYWLIARSGTVPMQLTGNGF